jgi:lysozyme
MKTPLTYSREGLHLTEQFEGCRLQAYQDIKGVWTIGYGHTRGVYLGQTITQAQAEAFLLEDVQVAVAAVNCLVTVQLTQHEFDALVDFVFNIGETAFATSTLLRRLNVRNFAAAAGEFERWDMCGGQHVAGLLRRRLAEKAEFLSETA